MGMVRRTLVGKEGLVKNMEKTRKLFFAIPFDSATFNQYEHISVQIRNKYADITTVIGNKQIGPSPQYSDIATFKAQNRELNEQFVKQISEADIVIADLTNNNPNVHVELGIALDKSKNIFRVTGRDLSNVGFDVRNLETLPYKNQEHLLNAITTYLDMFFKIKNLPFQDEYEGLYRKLSAPERLKAFQPDSVERVALLDLASDLSLRDGAVRVRFRILRSRTPADWFGVCFRVAGLLPWEGCHMVYVRQNGQVDAAVYPGPKLLYRHQIDRNMEEEQELMIEFENDALSVQTKGVNFKTETLTHQRAGRVVLVALSSDVEITSAEVISRDTIEWD